MTERSKTRPNAATRATEKVDALIEAGADDPPTSEEEQRAERAGAVDDEAARSYKEALERGARQEGEGRIS